MKFETTMREAVGREAKQARSRATTEKIVAAALSLLSEKEFDAISVADVARRARISIGGFYARFRSKEALLEWFHGAFLDGVISDFERKLDPDALAGASVRDVAQTYISSAAAAFERHRPILRQVALRSRTSLDAGFRARIVEANRRLHGRFRQLVLERRAQIRHREPELAFDLALTFVSAALREYVLFREERPHFKPVAVKRLVPELTAAFCAYLGVP